MSTQLIAMRNDVIFQFDQDHRNVGDGRATSQAFQEKTDWGFEFHNFSESTNQPRWGHVVATGPMCAREVTIGSRILIEALKWTNHTVVDGQQYWKTSDEFVIGVAEEGNE